jgi:dihydrofolate reductase
MRKLIESTLVSLDGVIGSPDRWSPFDEESRQLAKEELEQYDALVLGRVTYEFFRANRGAPTGDPYIDRINAIPKYVASRTLGEATWNGTLLGPDIVGAIEQLKAQPGKDLFKMGTGRVDETLLRAQCGSEPGDDLVRMARTIAACATRTRHTTTAIMRDSAMARPGLEPGTPRFSVVRSRLSNDAENPANLGIRAAHSLGEKSANSGLSSPIRERDARRLPIAHFVRHRDAGWR